MPAMMLSVIERLRYSTGAVGVYVYHSVELNGTDEGRQGGSGSDGSTVAADMSGSLVTNGGDIAIVIAFAQLSLPGAAPCALVAVASISDSKKPRNERRIKSP